MKKMLFPHSFILVTNILTFLLDIQPEMLFLFPWSSYIGIYNEDPIQILTFEAIKYFLLEITINKTITNIASFMQAYPVEVICFF